MQSPIPDYLEDILESAREERHGEIPTYIPQLAENDPEWLGAAVCTTSGNIYSTGDDDVEFTIQSISKPFAYALAIEECGLEEVLDTVGLEPSGESFNELSLGRDKRPMNAMINAGAIAVNQLINGEDSEVDERVEKIREVFSNLAGRQLVVDEKSAETELEGADRNLSIAHMLRSYDIIEDDAHDAVLSYIRQCSVLVTAKDLAVMSATLANGGVNPVTKQRIFSPPVARLVMSVMSSAGMYDAAGRWMARVGIPAKSGVSGGLIGMLPGQLGIATLSPRLDESGNSVRGVRIFEKLSEDMGLHLMNVHGSVGEEAVRDIREEDDDAIVELQGAIDFSAAESALHTLVNTNFDCERIVLDMTAVSGTQRMGTRMLGEGLRRLREGGLEIAVVDPDDRMGKRKLEDGTIMPKLEEI